VYARTTISEGCACRQLPLTPCESRAPPFKRRLCGGTGAARLSGIYEELDQNTRRLEAHLQNMQDSEFTVQDGTLFMLQTRNGKRTGVAALRVGS